MNIYDLQDGDILFKNTEMDDKGKAFSMKIVNQITSGWQNLVRRVKKLPKVVGMDHTEFLMWNGTILETHSSVSGPGVRTQNFMKWIKIEGEPKVLILRRPQPFTVEEKQAIQKRISADRGIPYALIPALKEGFDFKSKSEQVSESEVVHRGMFCSESSLRFSLFPLWSGKWPAEVYDFLIKEGYYIVFNGEVSDLVKS